MTELVDYAERMTRAAIRELPDGVYDFLDHIDDDGIDVGKPIPLKVTITKAGDRVDVDWTGTSPQVKGAINNTLSYTKSASYCAIRSILPQNIPTNEGVFRAIGVTAPAGHDRQRRAAGGLRGARAHRLPHGRLPVRRARQDAAGPGLRRLRRRQHRRLDRRLPPGPHAVHLCRFHLLRLGRAALCRRARRQLAHLRQHGLAADRGDRDRAAVADHRLRIHPGRDGAGQVPRRRAVPPRIQAPGRGGGAAGALRPPRFPPVRAVWRRPGPAVDELPEPGREPGAACPRS